MLLQLPYGCGYLEYNFPANSAVLTSHIDSVISNKAGIDLVRDAMDKPLNSPPLYELARDKRSAVIIISDHTRPVPSTDILPNMLHDLRRDNPRIQITLLVATGCHREMRNNELITKLGTTTCSREKIVVHDAYDSNGNIKIGELPSGAPLVIDKIGAECDLLVAEGFIEPHFFAGFSGGRKSVLPGICDSVTVMGNHCSDFIDNKYSRTGILDNNLINIDMEYAACLAKLAFIVNVVIDKSQKTIAAFAGDAIAAHRAGCEFLRKYCETTPRALSDIVITTNGGAPLDQNVYQSVKGITAAEAAAKDGAVIIVCAECRDGIGGDNFYHQLSECTSPEELYSSFMNISREQTSPDQWQSQILARIMMKHDVIFVTREELRKKITNMKMKYAATIEEAMRLAYEIKGTKASITVIPNGVSVIVR